METKIVELDLRQLPPPERHKRIFQIWESLQPGETMKIINDHDPKPLYYHFLAEFAGRFEWAYLQNGPVDWMVTILKTA